MGCGDGEGVGKPIPKIAPWSRTSPDGRLYARVIGNRVELISLLPDVEEIACRGFHTRPNVWLYREGYEAALAAKDDFAARFYLKLLPPEEQKMKNDKK